MKLFLHKARTGIIYEWDIIFEKLLNKLWLAISIKKKKKKQHLESWPAMSSDLCLIVPFLIQFGLGIFRSFHINEEGNSMFERNMPHKQLHFLLRRSLSESSRLFGLTSAWPLQTTYSSASENFFSIETNKRKRYDFAPSCPPSFLL